MCDWDRLVRERLPLPPLKQELEDSIIEDISVQLEDCYREVLSGGATEGEARAAALEHIRDWNRLASDIIQALGTRKVDEADLWLEEKELDLRRRGRRWAPLADLSRDVRVASRMLIKRPAFTILAVLSLAVGLGAATAIFSLTNAVLMKSLPIHKDEEVIEIFNGDFGNLSYPEYLALKEFSEPFLELAARDEFWYGEDASKPLFVRSGPEALRVNIGMVSGNYFSMLGVAPAAGRLLVPGDNRLEGGNAVVVLSWSFWQKRYDGDPGIVGKEIDLSGISYRVIGVAAEGFHSSNYRSSIDIWIPVVMRRVVDPPDVGYDIVQSDNYWIHVIGRLKDGTIIEQAQARIDAFVAGSDRLSESFKERGANLQPIRKSVIMPPLRERVVIYLRMLMLAVGLVVLVVCVNVTNLFAGRMDERRAEISIRRALGAGRGILLRQYLVESGIVALMGGIGAFIVSMWLDSTLYGMLAGSMGLSSSVADINPDLRVLGFTFGLVLICSLVIGVLPAFRKRPDQLSLSPRPGSGVTRSDNRFFNLQNLLVIGQLTLSLVLLTGAGLMVRTFLNLQSQNVGLDTRNVLMLSIDNERIALDARSGSALYDRILDRVHSIPGIEGASIAKVAPLSGITWGGMMYFEGYEPGPDERTNAYENYVDPGFFEMMGIPIVIGRGFTDQDIAGSENVVIVNEDLVRRYWRDSDPLGKTIRWWSSDGEGKVFRVIGVVRDHFYSSLRSGVRPLTYYPIAQQFLKNPVLLTRTAADPQSMAPAISAAIREVDPALNLFNQITLEDQAVRSGRRERVTMILLFLYAGIALLLSVVGTYGVMSSLVNRRRQEIGIRIALGARNGEVMGFVLLKGVKLIAAGLIAGTLLALGATTILRRLVFGIGTSDPVTYITVGAMLAAAALAACFVPARRVTRVDPIQTLRTE